MKAMTRRRFLALSGLATAGALVMRVPGLRAVAAPPAIDWSRWTLVEIWRPTPTETPLVVVNGYSYLRPADREEALQTVKLFSDVMSMQINGVDVRPDALPYVTLTAKRDPDGVTSVDNVCVESSHDGPVFTFGSEPW